MNTKAPDAIEHLAHQIRVSGLGTPVAMLLDTLAPLGFVGEQALLALRPLLPQSAATFTASLARTLNDEHERARLRALLSGDQPPTER